jgi:hypothetical protein
LPPRAHSGENLQISRQNLSYDFNRIPLEVMDYCEDFRLIQASLNHCNEFVKRFDKINSYGGEKMGFLNLLKKVYCFAF